MRCSKVRRNMMAFHDGELGTAEGKRMSKHLESCVECSRVLVELERADHAANPAEFPGPESSYWDTFTGRVMEKVKDEALAHRYKPGRGSVPSRFFPLRFAPALSVALVVVVAAGVLMKIRNPVIPEGEREAVLGKEVFPATQEAPPIDLESKGAVDYSTLEKGSPGLAPVKKVDSTVISKTAPPTFMDSTSVKKEAVAGETERSGDMAEETGTRFEERDDLFTAAVPSSTGLETARSLSVPSQEPAAEYESVETTDELHVAGAIDDGSWGQLAFARSLEEKGRHAESEKVLDDLLARDPAESIQEQASILMVSVLANQNRLPEARQVLEEAQRQYPANVMLQNYRIENGE
jgi:hypothetical protein